MLDVELFIDTLKLQPSPIKSYSVNMGLKGKSQCTFDRWGNLLLATNGFCGIFNTTERKLPPKCGLVKIENKYRNNKERVLKYSRFFYEFDRSKKKHPFLIVEYIFDRSNRLIKQLQKRRDNNDRRQVRETIEIVKYSDEGYIASRHFFFHSGYYKHVSRTSNSYSWKVNRNNTKKSTVQYCYDSNGKLVQQIENIPTGNNNVHTKVYGKGHFVCNEPPYKPTYQPMYFSPLKIQKPFERFLNQNIVLQLNQSLYQKIADADPSGNGLPTEIKAGNYKSVITYDKYRNITQVDRSEQRFEYGALQPTQHLIKKIEVQYH